LVKITFKPYEELIVHERQRFALDDMIRLRCTGMQVGSIAPNFQWADGLVMWRETFPQNEEITKENLDGRVHWLWVGYSEMPEHKPSVVYKETSVIVPVIDLSNNPIYSAAARWLKEQQQQQKE
jgi:hypothetical protein